MKHIQIFSLLFVLLFLTATLADEERDESLREDKEKQAREMAQEALAGRNVCVRFYNDWKKAPRAYKLVEVELDGLSFQCDSVIKAFGPMSESAAIVVAGQDQTDEAVAAIIDKFVYTELYTYKKGGRIYIWSEGGIRH